MADMQDFVGNIKALSLEKTTFTQSLEEENEILRDKVLQLTSENEAFLQENAATAELCLAQGIRDESGNVPDQPVRYLIQERAQFMDKVEEEDGRMARLADQLDTAKQEVAKMRQIEMQKKLLEKQVRESISSAV